MKYFLDTEFIEKPGSIQLISIGIVDETGRTFYAENITFDERDANDWIVENVLENLKWYNCRTDTMNLSDVDPDLVVGAPPDEQLPETLAVRVRDVAPAGVKKHRSFSFRFASSRRSLCGRE